MFEFKREDLVTGTVKTFTEETAPRWLKYGGRENSTMCNRWFWKNHVMTLNVGESVGNDFSIITRTA